ncbi:MAG: helix-turn-helix transcriptional regulator [Kiritimatiellae bacterium]|nr:helix-turn-helix transcriptional regulator [Kiritimatiellia bacterium]
MGLPRVGSAVNLGNWSTFAHTLGARQIGFCHTSHLSNSFKRATGLSPKAWLKS